LLAATALAAEGTAPPLDPVQPRFQWSEHYLRYNKSCVLTGIAISELRDDAFELQFRQALGEKLKLFVIIPSLPKGGTVFMEAPTTHDRWKIFSDSYVPALQGEQADSLRRNVAAGIPLTFTFDYGKAGHVTYTTAPTNAIVASGEFTTCINELEIESLKAVSK